MPITPLATAFSPAQASTQFKTMLNNSTLAGQYIPMSAAFPQSRFPDVSSLGLGEILKSNANDIFPFKDTTLSVTDIEVPTTILVLDKKTSEIKYQTNKFILQHITKPNMERFQIIETFGDPSVYFYNMRTRVYTIQGLLMDAEDINQTDNFGGTPALDRAKGKYYWATAFQSFYEDHLRGTQLKTNNQVAAIYINNWFIKGYPIQLVIAKDSTNLPQAVSFQMTWVIENETLLSKNKATWLYEQSRVTPATAAAINQYLDAINTYQVKYNAWKQESQASEDALKLANEKNAAELKVKSALLEVEKALAAEPTNRTKS